MPEHPQLAYVSLPTVTGSPPDFVFAGRAFSLDAYQNGAHTPGLVFEKPITVTVYYAPADVVGLDENTLEWNLDEWADMLRCCFKKLQMQKRNATSTRKLQVWIPRRNLNSPRKKNKSIRSFNLHISWYVLVLPSLRVWRFIREGIN